MEYWLSAVFSTIQFLAVIYFFDAFFVRKHEGFTFWGEVAIWLTLAIIIINLEGSTLSLAKIFIVPALFLGACLLFYNGNTISKIFVSFTVYALFNALSYAFEFAVMSLFNLNRNSFVNNRLLYILVAIIETVSMLIFSILVKHLHKPKKYQHNTWPWTLLVVLFPLTTMLALLLFYSATSNSNYSTSLMTACLIIMLISNIAVLALIDWLQRRVFEHEKLLAMNERVRSQEESLSALEAAYATQRKITHDFGKHIEVLSNLLSTSQWNAALDYIEQLQEKHTERILLVNTHNSAIDAILNQKAIVAREKGIDIHFEVNDLSKIHIKSIDCTVVLGNLFDNAIEACCKLPEQNRWINARIVLDIADNRSLFISILNSSLPVKIENDEISTTKEDPSLHGFGLYNVICILQKYNAEYVMTYKNGEFLFGVEWPDINL